MSYFPVPEDRSGQILASGMMGAADASSKAMQGIGQDIGGAIASLANSFVQGRQLKAKAEGYADFLGMHGEQLGFNPEWLSEFKKKSPMQQIALGDMLVSSFVPHQQRMAYLNRSGEIYGRTGGSGMGGGGGTGDVLYDFGE